jgi:hypothetical protein
MYEPTAPTSPSALNFPSFAMDFQQVTFTKKHVCGVWLQQAKQYMDLSGAQDQEAISAGPELVTRNP